MFRLMRSIVVFSLAFVLGSSAAAALAARASDCHYSDGPDGEYEFELSTVTPTDIETATGERYEDILPHHLYAGIPPWPEARSPFLIEGERHVSYDETARFFLFVERAR